MQEYAPNHADVIIPALTEAEKHLQVAASLQMMFGADEASTVLLVAPVRLLPEHVRQEFESCARYIAGRCPGLYVQVWSTGAETFRARLQIALRDYLVPADSGSENGGAPPAEPSVDDEPDPQGGER